MGNPIYTGPAFHVSFICFVENVKCIQPCQTCHLQGGKCLLGYWKWMTFHSVNYLPSLQHLCFLGQNRLLLFPILCLPTCTATKLLARTFPIFQTDGIFEMNYTQFHSQPNPSHSIITTDKKAHRFASYACKGLFYPHTDRRLKGQHCGLNIPQRR